MPSTESGDWSQMIQLHMCDSLINKEHEVSWIFDTEYWIFECPMANIEYPVNFTPLHQYSQATWMCKPMQWLHASL